MANTKVAPHVVVMTGNNTNTGLVITIGPGAPVAQTAWIILDSIDAPILTTGRLGGGTVSWGDNASAWSGVIGGSNVMRVQLALQLDYDQYDSNPPGFVQFPDARIFTNTPTGFPSGGYLRAGTGAPGLLTAGISQEGDQYIQRDGTPLASSGTGVLWDCVAAGLPGTWVARL